MVAASFFMKAIGVACLAGAPTMASPTRALRSLHTSHGACAPGEVKQQYEQCGGNYYAGCDQCAPGFECVGGQWYKQCKQTQDLRAGAQCGGQYYRGPYRCAAGLECIWRDASYSECILSDDASKSGYQPSPQPLFDSGAPAIAPGLAPAGAAPMATEFGAPMEAIGRRLASVDTAADVPSTAGTVTTTVLPTANAPASAPVNVAATAMAHSAGAAAPAEAKISGPPAGEWQQCGGKGYDGPEQCTPGFVCKKFSMYWSQCIYETMPSDGLPLWSQCGGKGYPGPYTCAEPGYCKYDNLYYSQCVPK